jgi:hypothetical protein
VKTRLAYRFPAAGSTRPRATLSWVLSQRDATAVGDGELVAGGATAVGDGEPATGGATAVGDGLAVGLGVALGGGVVVTLG